MNHHRARWVLIVICLAAMGCARPIVQADNPVAITGNDYHDTFEVAIDVLRDNGFVIDRRDYRFGRITTLPLGSPNLFEVWNDQNTTREQAVESTLASERRRVNVTINQPSQADTEGYPENEFQLEVEVILERRQAPTRRLVGSARRNVFSNLAAAPKELADRGITGSYWQPVGRDPYLEARLVKQIIDRAQEGK